VTTPYLSSPARDCSSTSAISAASKSRFLTSFQVIYIVTVAVEGAVYTSAMLAAKYIHTSYTRNSKKQWRAEQRYLSWQPRVQCGGEHE
jgi:hypothetical protein